MNGYFADNFWTFNPTFGDFLDIAMFLFKWMKGMSGKALQENISQYLIVVSDSPKRKHFRKQFGDEKENISCICDVRQQKQECKSFLYKS